MKNNSLNQKFDILIKRTGPRTLVEIWLLSKHSEDFPPGSPAFFLQSVVKDPSPLTNKKDAIDFSCIAGRSEREYRSKVVIRISL